MVESLTKWRHKYEDRGWLNIGNSNEIKTTIARLLERKAPTTLQWVKGHSGLAGNEGADKAAEAGRTKPANSDDINTEIRRSLGLPGAKLRTLTQGSAYRAIREIRMKEPRHKISIERPSTLRNMKTAMEGATSLTGRNLSDKQIWVSLAHKDFSKKIRNFMWTIMHDGYKIGHFWSHLAGYEERGICKSCHAEESIEHVLTKCNAPGQKEIWDLAGEIWEQRNTEWIRPGMGEILACGTTDLKDADGKPWKGDSRLYRILISESAHLIWKLRNGRVINNEANKSKREIENRWRAALNSRLRLDCLMVNSKYGSRSNKAQVVKRTWLDSLQDKQSLPEDWIWRAGVLVGSRAGVG
ncbi:hypothetical protein CPB83DRAFT_822857 [Crepidotus variabilis]|uniref:RNase H type-1 domain-containing protein n=1 Tax=Crepidotus variabilis TaxID=179855 RepID=A0A9P6E4P4_9AGAR|nr:hypothetical protein CPB83DRAFT_822857 [Crepidotus variabilis]